MQGDQQPSRGQVMLGEDGEPEAQLPWLGPQGPTLLVRDSHVQLDTRCHPLQMAVRKEKKQQQDLGPL